jgi:hypothetical protein
MCSNALIGPALLRCHSRRASTPSRTRSFVSPAASAWRAPAISTGARAEIEAIKALRAALEKSNQSYWADRSEEQILAISAWVAFKEGARDQALKFMRAADSPFGATCLGKNVARAVRRSCSKLLTLRD